MQRQIMPDKNDAIEMRRRQIRYRVWRRGIKEMDFILGRYADEHLDHLNASQLTQFEALLELPDQDLYAWICGTDPVPDEFDNEIMSALKSRPAASASSKPEGR